MAASEQGTGGAVADTDIDYAQAYKDVHTINRLMVTKTCPRVMTVYRMYLPLTDLDCGALEGAGGVEELLVVADVVAVDGNKALRLPGNRRVVIVCRLVVATQHLSVGQAALPNGINIHVSLAADASIADVSLVKRKGEDHYSYRAPQFAAGVPTQLFVYAQQLLFDQEDAGLALSFLQPLASLTTDLWTANDITGKHATDSLKECTLIHQGARTFADFMQPVRLLKQKLLGDEAPLLLHYFDEQEGGARVHQVLGPSVGVSVRGSDQVPAHLLADANVVMGLQATLLAAEGILLYGQNSAGAVTGALRHARWLTTHVLPNRGLVQDAAQGEELRSLYVRAQALVTLYGSGKYRMLVPGLNYKLYRQVIEDMAGAAKLYDQELNATLRQIESLQVDGDYFLAQNKVLAQKEEDMEAYAARVGELQKHELDEALAHLDKLNGSMATQQAAMEQAQRDMDAGVKRYVDEQIAKAAFAVIGAIFAVVAAVATAGAALGAAVSAVKDLAKVGKGLVKVVEVLKKLYTLLRAVQHLREELAAKKGEQPTETTMPDVPSDSEWDIFVNEIELVAESMPSEVSEKNAWKAKCKNVAAVGREICLTTLHVTALQYQLSLLGWQQEMAAKQRQRLLALQPADLGSYAEMALQLEMKTRRIINGLLTMLNVQNGALYYHYLQEPEEHPAGGPQPTVGSVQQMLLDRDRSALDWQEFLGKSSDVTRTYVVRGAPVEVLLAGQDLDISIAVADTLAFPASWQRVRIRYVEVRFTGGNTPATDTGELYFLLRGDRVFQDRLQGRVLRYQAARPLQYAYAYDLGSGETTFGNRDISTEEGEFMRMTPFNRWKLRASLSAQENANLRFADASANAVTDITLTFFLTVIRAHDT